MPTTNLDVRPQDAISPTLYDTTSTAHYQTTLTWQLDATTLLPVGTTQHITIGS